MDDDTNVSAINTLVSPIRVSPQQELAVVSHPHSSHAKVFSADSLDSEDSSQTVDYTTDDRSHDSSEDEEDQMMQEDNLKRAQCNKDLLTDTREEQNNEGIPYNMENDQDSDNITNTHSSFDNGTQILENQKKQSSAGKKVKFKFKKSTEDDPDDPKKSCDICFRRFAYRGAVKRHKREVHCIVRKHICPTCNKPFARNGTLRIHLLTHTGEKPHVCKVCGKSYRQSSQLTEHSVVHTGDKRFICSVCGDCFPTRSKLNRHKIIHSDERPFVCDICQRGFRTMMNMLDHRPVHSDYKPFICCMCGKSFHTYKNLQSHERGHQIKHMCSYCDKGFSRPSALAEHKLTHLKIKPFPCKLCDKTFPRQKSLQEHMSLHTGDKPYACDMCEKKFCRMKALKRHLLIHQKK